MGSGNAGLNIDHCLPHTDTHILPLSLSVHRTIVPSHPVPRSTVLPCFWRPLLQDGATYPSHVQHNQNAFTNANEYACLMLSLSCTPGTPACTIRCRDHSGSAGHGHGHGHGHGQ